MITVSNAGDLSATNAPERLHIYAVPEANPLETLRPVVDMVMRDCARRRTAYFLRLFGDQRYE
jgi:hypothetical protein